MLNHRLHCVLFALLISLTHVLTVSAQDVLPDRPGPGQNQDAKQRTQDAIDAIYERWERDRNPKIVVIIGIQNGDQVVYNTQSQMVNRIISPLKRHLRDATDRRSIVVPSLKDLQDNRLVDLLARDAGNGLSDVGADILKKTFDGDLIVDLTLLDSDRPGRYALNMRVTDTREGVELASDSLATVSTSASESQGVLIADAIIRSFAREYASERRPSRRAEARTFEFKLLGVEQEGGISQRALSDLANALEESDPKVKWVEFDFASVDDTGFAKMEARYGARQRDLLILIEDEVLPDLDLAWRVQATDGNVIVAYIYPNDIPAWFSLTDPNAPDFQDTIRLRNTNFARNGLPELGIVVGEDLQEPLDAFDAGRDAPESFGLQALEASIQDQFVQLGFRVVDNVTLRTQLRQQLGNAVRYENLTHMVNALSDLDAVDLVLHLNVKPGSRGNSFIARMIDVSDAQVIGVQVWSAETVSRLERTRVDSSNPDQVARYLAGQMLARYDRFVERDLNTVEVQVRNIDSAEKVLEVVEIVNTLEQVHSVVDVQAVTPVASFEVVYTGDRSAVTFGLINAIGIEMPAAELQFLGHALIVNTQPITVSEKIAEEREAVLREQLDDVLGIQEPRQVSDVEDPADEPEDPEPKVVNVDDDTPKPIVNNNNNQTSDLRSFLLAARNSVYTVGVEVDGRFNGNGTAWQVGEGVLATNAHVVFGLVQERANQIQKGVSKDKIKFVGLAGPNHDHRIEIKLDTVIHPEYVKHQQKWNQFLNQVAQQEGKEIASQLAALLPLTKGDVGLLWIENGASKPVLKLAGQEVLKGQMNPTDPVAYIGFPSENLAKLTNLDIPAQQIDLGTIMSITDFDQRPGTPATRQLIQNDLVADGGASGSPIFNEKGEVVAVLFAGSIVSLNEGVGSGRRVRTGVIYGQRVDLVKDLLEGRGLKVIADDFLQQGQGQNQNQ